MADVATAEDFPLVQIAVDWLEPGASEKYQFHEQGARALELGLNTLFLAGVDPKPALGQLAGLVEALRKAGAATAADEITKTICAHPKAGAFLKSLDSSGRAQEAEKFLSGVGRKAQHVEDKAPDGSVPLSALAVPPPKIR